MNHNELLHNIYYEQKTTNTKLQKLSCILLVGIVAWLKHKSIEKGDEKGMKFCNKWLSILPFMFGFIGCSELIQGLKRVGVSFNVFKVVEHDDE